MSIIWPTSYTLNFIVSEPEETLEISFWSFLIFPLETKALEDEEVKASEKLAVELGGERREWGYRLPDSWPSAPAIKRKEKNKNWYLSYFQEHLISVSVGRDPLTPMGRKIYDDLVWNFIYL